MTNEDGSVDIRIELPLPIDISGSLINAIGLTWPDAVIKDGKGQWRSDNRLVLSIPAHNRHNSPQDAAKYQEAKAHLEAESETFINELSPNAMAMGLPTWLADQFIAIARVWMDQFPDETNYLESILRDKPNSQEWVFIVAKGAERTPHALRKEADAKLDKLRQQALTADWQTCASTPQKFHQFVLDIIGVTGDPDTEPDTK